MSPSFPVRSSKPCLKLLANLYGQKILKCVVNSTFARQFVSDAISIGVFPTLNNPSKHLVFWP